MKNFTNLVLIAVCAFVPMANAQQDMQLPPFPAPNAAPSAAPTNTSAFVTGNCPTVNAIAYFSAVQTLTCNANLTTDGAGRIRTADGTALLPSHSFTSNTTMGMALVADPNVLGANMTMIGGGDQRDVAIGRPFVYGAPTGTDDFVTIFTSALVVAAPIIANQNQALVANQVFDEWCNADASLCGLEIVAADASGHYDLHFVESATATAATASEAHIHDDSTSHRLQLSNNGGSYFTIVTTGESETFTSTSWTFSNDMAIALSGGVNGLSIDGTTTSWDATNHRVGIGTAAPDSQLHQAGTTLANSSSNFIYHVEGNSNGAATTSQTGGEFKLTTAGSSANAQQVAFEAWAAAGYTGSGPVIAVSAFNDTLGTGTQLLSVTSTFNQALRASTLGAATGANIGTNGYAEHSSALNVGVLGLGLRGNTNVTAPRIGVYGNGSSDGTEIGGYFSLRADSATNPTFESGALIADNDDETAPILVLRDNGSHVFLVNDGGFPQWDQTAPTVDAAGTCTTDPTMASNSTNEAITITAFQCNATQTIILTFNGTWPNTQAPTCTFSPTDTDTVTGAFFISSASTTVLTLTATVNMAAAGSMNIMCTQST